MLSEVFHLRRHSLELTQLSGSTDVRVTTFTHTFGAAILYLSLVNLDRRSRVHTYEVRHFCVLDLHLGFIVDINHASLVHELQFVSLFSILCFEESTFFVRAWWQIRRELHVQFFEDVWLLWLNIDELFLFLAVLIQTTVGPGVGFIY